MGKKFVSDSNIELFYEVVEQFWLDKDTYVVVFNEMTDVDGDTYHIEVEYHNDEKRITYTMVYDDENIEDSFYFSPFVKKKIEEYILKEVGVSQNN